MVTLEYIDRPANLEVFRQTLDSAFTKLSFPEAPAEIVRHRSHILIGVSHGVFGGVDRTSDLMKMLDMKPEGASLPQFLRRLDACAMLGFIAHTEVPASVVHWTQSNNLLPGKLFEEFAGMSSPSLMHIHPWLFGGQKDADGRELVGMRTFGLRHFIGGEALIEPSPLPWLANYETIMAFLRVCIDDNGYIIPDGDSFGPEDRSQSYRVNHRPAADNDVPIYELEPLMRRDYGYRSPAYVPPERVFDDRSAPADLMPKDLVQRDALLDEWRAKRGMAEGIGGRFEVRARLDPPARPQSLLDRLSDMVRRRNR
jgi:hypothetical protein